MKKDEKEKLADELRQQLAKARSVIAAGFEGLTVAQDTELRRKVAQSGAKYKVVKNTLLERAAQGTPVEPVAQNLRGTTSLAFTETDPMALAKALVSYAKENPALVFKAGMVEGRVVSLGEFNALASLPGRHELFAKVLFVMQSPARKAVFTLLGVARNLAWLVQQGVREKKFKEEADS